MIVVDTSAIIDALGVADASEALHQRLVTEQLHAPALLDYEVVSVLRRMRLAGRISGILASDILGDFDDLPIQRWRFPDAFKRRAFQLRNNLSAYAASFIVLAEALECPVVTRDAKLAGTSVHGVHIEVL